MKNHRNQMRIIDLNIYLFVLLVAGILCFSPLLSYAQPDESLLSVEDRLSLDDLNFDDIDPVFEEELTLPEELPQKSQAQLEQEIRQEAFEAALTGLFPLRPEEIRRLLEFYDDTQNAVSSPVHGFPEPEVSVQTISLDPGFTPPLIKTSPGHVTTLNVLDSTGSPWPIQDVTWAGDFEIVEPEEGGHIIRITPLTENAYGNMSVRMLTLKTPITFTLRTSDNVVQYRVDIRLPDFGPFAQAPLIEASTAPQITAGDAVLTAVLDGTPPGSAVRLDVSGVDGRTTAFRVGEVTYVRTPLTLLSPGWQSSATSADGTNVYTLNNAPVLLLSDNGRFTRARLTEQQGSLFDE